MDDDPLYTLPEVAKYLRVHPRTALRWVREGSLPAVRVGKRFRVRRSTIDALLAPADEESVS